MRAPVTLAAGLTAFLFALTVQAQPPAPAAPATRPEHRGPHWQVTDFYPGLQATDFVDHLKLDLPIQLSGYFWVDTGYMKRVNAQSGQPDQNAQYMQGRFVLAADYERQVGSLRGAARVELMGLDNEFAKSAYEPHTLDAYISLGQKRWEVRVGRFLAWEVYYRGQGIELYTAEEAGATDAPPMYLLDFTRGHKNEAGQAALRLYPFDALGIEVAGVYGQEANQNNLGVRPVVDLRLGVLEVVSGYEYLDQSPQTDADKVKQTLHGFGGRAQLRFGRSALSHLPILTFGVDAARATIDRTDILGVQDTSASLDRTSIGGFADLDLWRSSIGVGYHFTDQKNRRGENNQQEQAFVSYLHRLPIDGMWVKAVAGFAKAHIESIDTGRSWNNELSSIRVRLGYQFQ
jgi:hypothetical protein